MFVRFPMSRGSFLRRFLILFFLGKHRFEPAINFAQFPENQNKQNCDYEQQELDDHLFSLSGLEMETFRAVLSTAPAYNTYRLCQCQFRAQFPCNRCH